MKKQLLCILLLTLILLCTLGERNDKTAMVYLTSYLVIKSLPYFKDFDHSFGTIKRNHLAFPILQTFLHTSIRAITMT